MNNTASQGQLERANRAKKKGNKGFKKGVKNKKKIQARRPLPQGRKNN